MRSENIQTNSLLPRGDHAVGLSIFFFESSRDGSGDAGFDTITNSCMHILLDCIYIYIYSDGRGHEGVYVGDLHCTD